MCPLAMTMVLRGAIWRTSLTRKLWVRPSSIHCVLKQRWETWLSLPIRYLDNNALGSLQSGMERAGHESGLGRISDLPQGEGPCWDEYTKLRTFRSVRYQNPWGVGAPTCYLNFGGATGIHRRVQ